MKSPTVLRRAASVEVDADADTDVDVDVDERVSMPGRAVAGGARIVAFGSTALGLGRDRATSPTEAPTWDQLVRPE